MSPPFSKVIIVGAGPSGLLLSLLLSLQGIHSTVLESWPHLDSRLRATQYGVPAARVFARAGVLPELREKGLDSFPSICWRRTKDGEKLVSINLGLVKDSEDRMVIMPLGDMVQIFYENAVAKGVDVRFGHKVRSTGQDGKEAWVDVDVMEGETCLRRERLTADYVIGCDGATSVVRKTLFGRDWPGLTLPYRFMVQNVFYDGFEKHGWDGGNYMIGDHWGLVARRGKAGLWRVTYGDDRTDLSDEELLERRPWHFEHMLPGRPKPEQYRIEQTNIYSVHNRCAPNFKVGRIFLAGDAAHVCNPWGGYGCMSAMLDVDGLAACLSGYYHNKADESILDKYADIRRSIFLRFVDDRSMRNLARCATADPDTVKETDPFFQLVQKLNQDPNDMKAFLLKISSIEHDFTQYYNTMS